MRCGRQDEQGPEVCEMQQQQTDKEGRTVMAVAVGKVPGSPDLGLLIMVPLGVLLPAGATPEIDSGAEMPLQVNRCERQGCGIELLLKPDLLTRFNRAVRRKFSSRRSIRKASAGGWASRSRSSASRLPWSKWRAEAQDTATTPAGGHGPPGSPCQRAAASSSAVRASTQRSLPPLSSSFQNGAWVFSQSIRNAQASKAARDARRRSRPARSARRAEAGRSDGR